MNASVILPRVQGRQIPASFSTGKSEINIRVVVSIDSVQFMCWLACFFLWRVSFPKPQTTGMCLILWVCNAPSITPETITHTRHHRPIAVQVYRVHLFLSDNTEQIISLALSDGSHTGQMGRAYCSEAVSICTFVVFCFQNICRWKYPKAYCVIQKSETSFKPTYLHVIETNLNIPCVWKLLFWFLHRQTNVCWLSFGRVTKGTRRRERKGWVQMVYVTSASYRPVQY